MKKESLCLNLSLPQGCGGEGRKSYEKPEIWVCDLELDQALLMGSLNVYDDGAGRGIGGLAPEFDDDFNFEEDY